MIRVFFFVYDYTHHVVTDAATEVFDIHNIAIWITPFGERYLGDDIETMHKYSSRVERKATIK